MHVYVAETTFGYGAGRTLAFFLLHGAAMTVQQRLQLEKKNPLLSTLSTHAFLLATMPLYIGLFVEAQPEWVSD